MSDGSKQRNWGGKLEDVWHKVEDVAHKVEDVAHKGASKLKNAFHPIPPTPAPSNREGSPPGTTPILPSNTESAPSRVDNGEDALKGADTAQTDTPDTAQSKLVLNWEAWNIDGDAISDLLKWGAEHENSNWRKLADAIDGSLKSETLTALQDFIPDSPFPAKTLVKALLSIVQLGIGVFVIQKEVYEFAREAVGYFSTLAEVAGEEPIVKEDLKAICTAVNDICKWASKHVRKNTLSDHELGDWRSEFAKAKERFSARTLLKIRVEQAKEQRKALIREELNFITKELASHVAAQHKFTDQNKSLCAPGTRGEIQKEIEGWLSPQTSSSKHIFWITGIAGSGKSTLSATTVENLGNNETPVAAQFFISRNMPETIKPENFIPTIAQQLSEFSPAAAHIIHDRLKKKGFPSSQEEQVKALLLAPIQELAKSPGMVIIVIDALDELQNATTSVLEILSPITASGLPHNVRFVITSRGEGWTGDIIKTLERVGLEHIDLETTSSVKEVHDLIVARMNKITPWSDWPSPNEVQKLSDKANGLFHYAATALQWIDEQVHQPGIGKGDGNKLLQKFAEMGDGQLEKLYRLILTTVENIDVPAPLGAKWREDRLRNFRHVIGTILVLQKPLTIRQITALLADISADNFNVTNFLQQFRSVLISGTTESFEEAQPQMHKTFRDYIMNAAPDGFRIGTGDAHFVTARSCLEVIVKAGRESDPERNYSVQHWYQHLRKAVEEGVRFEDEKMWNLFGQMVGDAAVDIWKANSWPVFCDVATAGWKLLEQGTDEHRMEGILDIVVKAKELQLERWERSGRLRLCECCGGELSWGSWLKRDLDSGIPYPGIWNDGLLKTWKHRLFTSPEGPPSVSGNPTPKYQ